jgi:multidrug efflux pump subunit AcrB
MWLTRFGIRQPVLVHLSLALIVVLGISSYITLPRSLNPEVSFETVLVYTLWPGASALEVESQITNEIEEELEGLSNVKRISSHSSEARSAIVIEFVPDAVELIQAEQDVQSRVNRVDNLPEEAEEPEVLRFDTASEPVFRIALGSTGSFERLRSLADELAQQIEQIDGISEVDVHGDRDPEMWVEVDRVALEGLGMTLPDVIAAVRERNRNVPGGEIESAEREYLVRTLGEATRPEDIGEIVLRRSEGGGLVRVRDVAAVSATYEEPEENAFLNGEPCLMLNVTRRKDTNTIELYEQMMPVLERFRAQRGHECEATLFLDTSHEIRNRIHVLEGSAGLGLLLVAFILTLFLGWRNSIFALIGLPVAFLATFVLISAAGFGMDGVSLFALVLVIGILVDDAIVVLENVHRHMEDGRPHHEAALEGAREVALPVTASVSTTMAAFAPLLLVPGIMGQFIEEIPLVVIFALAASLFEVFFMMPCHIARHGRVPERRRHHHPVLSLLYRIYHALLAWCLRWRWLTLLMLAGILGLMPFIVPPVEMFPESDAFPRFTVNFELARGETLDATETVMEKVRAVIETLPEEELVSTLGVSGATESNYQMFFGSHYGMLFVLLTNPEDRSRSAKEIMDDLRPDLAQIEGLQRLDLKRIQEGPPRGEDIEIRLLGENLERLDLLAEGVKDIIREAGAEFGPVSPVTDISDDFAFGKEELIVRLDEARRTLFGVPTEDIFTSVAAAIDGVTAAEITIEDEEVDIIVRHPPEQRADPEDLLGLSLRTTGGGRVELREVADITYAPGYETVRHHDGDRVVTVTAEVDSAAAAPSEIYEKIEPRISALLTEHPGHTYLVGGAEEENRESIASVIQALALGLMLIYFILAAQFQSFIQPFVIMTTIPFAAFGVMLGLIINNENFTFPTMIGIVALTGIVVNDSLVLIDFINRGRRRHHNRLRAVIEAGRVRMRPILMTSVTTIGGLMPMVFGIVGNPGLFKPMAVAVCWGLAFATLLVLLVIPVIYLTFDDVAHWVRRRLRLRAPEHLAARDEEIAGKPVFNPQRRATDN